MTAAPTSSAPVANRRAALDATRGRIASTLDEIDRRVRQPAADISRGIAGLRDLRGGLELIGSAAAVVEYVRDVTRTARSLSGTQRAFVAGGIVGAVALLLWVADERDASAR